MSVTFFAYEILLDHNNKKPKCHAKYISSVTVAKTPQKPKHLPPPPPPNQPENQKQKPR